MAEFIVESGDEYLLGFRHVPRMTSDPSKAVRMSLETAEHVVQVLEFVGLPGEFVAVLEPIPVTDGMIFADNSAEAQMYRDGREVQYREKTFQVLLDEREAALQRVRDIEIDLDALGFDVRLLEE